MFITDKKVKSQTNQFIVQVEKEILNNYKTK